MNSKVEIATKFFRKNDFNEIDTVLDELTLYDWDNIAIMQAEKEGNLYIVVVDDDTRTFFGKSMFESKINIDEISAKIKEHLSQRYMGYYDNIIFGILSIFYTDVSGDSSLVSYNELIDSTLIV